MRFLGLNLTVPHKLLALPLVDELDASGARRGAINTIRFEARDLSGNWRPLAAVPPADVRHVRSVGFNTDADAIVRSILEDLQLSLSGKSVLVLGAGGAGSVAAARLAEEGIARLFLVNRTQAKAEEVAAVIRQRNPAVQASLGYPPGSVDLVLNATSLGLKPDDPLPCDVVQFPLDRAAAAYDMIYRPAETPFLQRARAAGCRVANGLGMLLYQGAQRSRSGRGNQRPLVTCAPPSPPASTDEPPFPAYRPFPLPPPPRGLPSPVRNGRGCPEGG